MNISETARKENVSVFSIRRWTREFIKSRNTVVTPVPPRAAETKEEL
ncbi:hypothetical protein MTQ12_08225 [Brevibacterium sp. R8603A2]|nr:hypothetical protein [Brevibacterium ihuae]MCK1803033.1 hypothetical protein [Brevibacterium sp. R8603A2]